MRMTKEARNRGSAWESKHEFHDPAYVRQWSRHALRRTPVRGEYMACIGDRVRNAAGPGSTVLEYGCGPGFLAARILQRTEVSCYWLVDFSRPMLDLCAARLARFHCRTRYARRDFTRDDWLSDLPCQPDIVVSMQATHEVHGARQIARLYAQVYDALAPAGRFLMCDLMDDAEVARDPSLFPAMPGHLDLLRRAGFVPVRRVLAKAGLGLALGIKPVKTV